ncbi:hypothetical protein BD560DRAFT_398214 [Blakeslea trispora]|nr:hypothetical protein BD560DRAFT_398214 [Blakeslea trispora]
MKDKMIVSHLARAFFVCIVAIIIIVLPFSFLFGPLFLVWSTPPLYINMVTKSLIFHFCCYTIPLIIIVYQACPLRAVIP